MDTEINDDTESTSVNNFFNNEIAYVCTFFNTGKYAEGNQRQYKYFYTIEEAEYFRKEILTEYTSCYILIYELVTGCMIDKIVIDPDLCAYGPIALIDGKYYQYKCKK